MDLYSHKLTQLPTLVPSATYPITYWAGAGALGEVGRRPGARRQGAVRESTPRAQRGRGGVLGRVPRRCGGVPGPCAADVSPDGTTGGGGYQVSLALVVDHTAFS